MLDCEGGRQKSCFRLHKRLEIRLRGMSFNSIVFQLMDPDETEQA